MDSFQLKALTYSVVFIIGVVTGTWWCNWMWYSPSFRQAKDNWKNRGRKK